MRRLLVMIGMVLGLGLGCGDDPVASVDGTEPAPPKARDGSAPAREATHDDRDVERIAMFGTLSTTDGRRIADRAVVLVDAMGERRDLRTDGRGRFIADEVAVPYDVAVSPGVDGVPTVVLGLAKPDPYVEVNEHEAPAPAAPPSQVLRVGVAAPVCSAPAEGACFVAVVTGSRSGKGQARAPCSGAAGAIVVEARHVWRAHEVAAGERIDMHLLTTCAGTSTTDAGLAPARPIYGYATVSSIAAAPGETTDLGMVAAMPVPTMAPMRVGAREPGELAAWSWSTEVTIDVPAGSPRSEMVIATASTATMPLVLPRLPASSFRVRLRASESRSDLVPGFERSVEAWSGARPVVPLGEPPGIVGIDVPTGPELVRPAVGATVAPRDVGFAWSPIGPALASLLVVDLVRGTRFRVITDANEITFDRLEALGLTALHEGPHVLELTTRPRRRLDEATSPDPAVRSYSSNGARNSAETRLRAPFEVLR